MTIKELYATRHQISITSHGITKMKLTVWEMGVLVIGLSQSLKVRITAVQILFILWGTDITLPKDSGHPCSHDYDLFPRKCCIPNTQDALPICVRWSEECSRTHESCHTVLSDRKPTRLISLNGSDVKLCLTARRAHI